METPFSSYPKRGGSASDLDEMINLLISIGLQAFSEKELAAAGLTPEKLREDIHRIFREPKISSVFFQPRDARK